VNIERLISAAAQNGESQALPCPFPATCQTHFRRGDVLSSTDIENKAGSIVVTLPGGHSAFARTQNLKQKFAEFF